MADLKAAFRAAQEQRGGAKQTPAQIRALRAAKQQQQQPGSQAVAPRTASPPAQAKPAKPASGQLPADFFQSGPSTSAPVAKAAASSQPVAPSTKRPAEAVPARGSVQSDSKQGPGSVAPVPEGFFQDKAADAKARGVKLPDEKDKEDEFQAFQRSIEEDLKQAAAQEAVAAEEEAEDREERENFAQWVRLQRIEEIKKRKRSQRSDDPDASEEPPEQDDMADAASVTAEMLGLATSMPDGLGKITLPKKARLKDTLAMLQAGGSEEESDDEEGLDALLDWRAKNV